MEDFSEEDIELDEEDRSKWKTRLGCLWVVAYLCMSVFEMLAIYDWIEWKYEINTFLSIIASVVAGFTPGLGSLLAYFGATEVWAWESLSAIAIFFWYYIPIVLISLLSAMVVIYALAIFVVGRLKAMLDNKDGNIK